MRWDANSFSLSSVVVVAESQREERVKHNVIISKLYERDDNDRRDVFLNNALTYIPLPPLNSINFPHR